MSPGRPVYLERSSTSAPGGMAEASLVTALMRSPSTMTMGLVHSVPFASQSLPKRTALIVFAADCSGATALDRAAVSTRRTNNRDTNNNDKETRLIRTPFVTHDCYA